jgi:hypothetical protein
MTPSPLMSACRMLAGIWSLHSVRPASKQVHMHRRRTCMVSAELLSTAGFTVQPLSHHGSFRTNTATYAVLDCSTMRHRIWSYYTKKSRPSCPAVAVAEAQPTALHPCTLPGSPEKRCTTSMPSSTCATIAFALPLCARCACRYAIPACAAAAADPPCCFDTTRPLRALLAPAVVAALPFDGPRMCERLMPELRWRRGCKLECDAWPANE